MNTFFVILFSVLSVAYAGIYSAKWPVNGEVPARLSLRSGLGIQWDHTSPGYAPTPETGISESTNTKFQNLDEKNVRSTVNPLEETEISNGGVESVEVPISSATIGQRSERQDIDSTKYISIGSIYSEPSTHKHEEQYRPKHVRSVTLVQESDSDVQKVKIEVPETPASTSRTPIGAYPSELRNFPSPNVGYPILPIPNYYGPNGFPTYIDTYQSTLPPLNRLSVQRDLINMPLFQSQAFAQNSPGYQLATANTISNGIGNGASSAAFSQNYGGVQTTASWANVDNSQAIATSLNDGYQQQNVALASNQNSNGFDVSQFQNNAQSSNQYDEVSEKSQFQNVVQSRNLNGDSSDESQFQNVPESSNQRSASSDESQFKNEAQFSNQDDSSSGSDNSSNFQGKEIN